MSGDGTKDGSGEDAPSDGGETGVLKGDDVRDELGYLQAVRRVLSSGVAENRERTGTGTLKLTAVQLRYRLVHRGRATVPALTCRRIAFRWVAEELLWFMRGSADATELSRLGVKIWEDNTSAGFLRKRGLADRLRPGELGPGYGWQWRSAGLDYWGPHRAEGVASGGAGGPDFTRAPTLRKKLTTGLSAARDQLAEAFALLRSDPASRRILVDSWNPSQLDEMALPPCHYSFQFLTRATTGAFRAIDCVVTMRSGDLGLGIPFNCVSYALLTHLAALFAGMVPGEVVINIGDCHVYETHRTVLSAGSCTSLAPKGPPPSIAIREVVKKLAVVSPRSLADFSAEVRAAAKFLDAVGVLTAGEVFVLSDYAPGPKVSMPMAV